MFSLKKNTATVHFNQATLELGIVGNEAQNETISVYATILLYQDMYGYLSEVS